MKLKIIFISLIFLLMPSVLAYNYQINVDSNYEIFNTDVYKCSDSGCSNIIFHSSSTTGEYSLVGSGDNYYAEYDYKLCFKPHIYRIHAWGDLSRTENYNILFNKKENCEAIINNAELSDDDIELGEKITITSNVHSGFEYPNGILETTAIPSNIKDEYSTNTKISIYANEIKIYETEAEILLASDKDFDFEWTPSSTGTYEIVAKSEVVDCACSSQETQEFLIGVLVVNEPPECSIDNNCQDDYYSDNYCSNNDVYKDYHDFSCLIGLCNEDVDKILVTDCGEDEYGNWSNYCQGDDVYKQRYYAQHGCSNGGCFVGTVIQHEFVKTCDYDCVSGECINEPEPVCGNNILEENEECDDGNLINNDGCSSLCEIEERECCTDNDCQDDYYSNNYCSNNDVYKDYHDFFCLIGLCNEDIDNILVEDCEEDYCEGFKNNYCSNGDVYHSKTCYNQGCLSGTCYSEDYEDEELVEECDYGCNNGICNPTPECSIDSECSLDFYSDKYCASGDVYKDYHDFSCVSESCVENIIKELVKECDNGCKNGQCKSDESDEDSWCIETNSCELTYDDETEFDNSITLKSKNINQTLGSIILNKEGSETEPASYFWVFVFVIAIIVILILLLLINLI